PAIENWEAQKATYQANYAAWQAQAQNDAQAMDNHVRTSQELLIRERNAYLNDVEAQIKDDREQFRQAQKRVDEGAADAEVRELLAKTSGTTESPGAIYTMLASRMYAPSNPESFLERPKDERPDFSKMEEVYAKFQTSLQGSLQIAQAQNLNSLARDTKTQVLEDVKKQLESTQKIEVTEKEIAAAVQQRIDKLVQKRNESPWEYHAPIDEAEIRKEVTENIRERKERLAWQSVSITDDGKVRAERKIATGYVHLKAGGDATDWEDYETEYTTQEFYFNGTRSVKLGATGALFTEEFDIGAAYEETQEDIQQYGQDVYEQMDDFMESLQRADDMNDSRETLADNNKQDKATSSKLMSSLIQTLYGGGDIGSWAQQQGQNVMASTIAEATGLPKSFFSGLLGGMTMEGAMENYMYDRIATELDDASGIDGFGSFFNQKVQEAQERAAEHKAMRGGNLLDFNQQFRHNEYFREAVKMTIPGAGSPFDPMTRAMNAVTQRLPGFR
ncbi:MAG: TIGR04388 family protein, partial [Leptospiraceae bacterium]|nr:TIGR04388 family protein [Leptospiraceae bacterium]